MLDLINGHLNLVRDRDQLLAQIEAAIAGGGGGGLAALRQTSLPILTRIADRLLADPGPHAASQLDRVAGLISALSAFGRPQLRSWTFTFGDVVVADADAADAGLGARTWPSGVILARLIDQGRVRLPDGGRVLELGSGTGLAGIVAGAVSARDGRSLRLTLSDGDAGVLANLGANLDRNRHLWQSRADQIEICSRALNWSEELNDVAIGDPFDAVLAADFCYDRCAASLVCRCTAAVLHPGGHFYAVVPVRARFEANLAEFAAGAPSWGLTLVDSETVVLEPSSDAAHFYCFEFGGHP